MRSCYVSKEAAVPYVNIVIAFDNNRMDLKERSDIINSLLYDLRAEYCVALLLLEGMMQNEISVIHDGPLKRRWSTDISSTEIENFENGDQALSLHLNRAGIYDALPESLFHTFSENRNATGEDMARESMKLKGEEKDARLFFRPLENEIFFHHVRVSLQENKELYKIYSEFINGLSPGFWRVDKRVQSKYSIRIIKLLPYVHRIMGNYDLTAQCLENVLDEKVSMQIEYDEPEKEEVIRAKADEPVVNYNELGKSKLGFNMVIGHSVSGFVARVTVKIGPLQNTALKEFFPEGKADLALKCFYSYFIPVEFDVETKLVMQKQRNKLVLGCSSEEESEKSFLGFNTVI